jgi:hypothetical protein
LEHINKSSIYASLYWYGTVRPLFYIEKQKSTGTCTTTLTTVCSRRIYFSRNDHLYCIICSLIAYSFIKKHNNIIAHFHSSNLKFLNNLYVSEVKKIEKNSCLSKIIPATRTRYCRMKTNKNSNLCFCWVDNKVSFLAIPGTQ